jgi:predicted transcriptional regulator
MAATTTIRVSPEVKDDLDDFRFEARHDTYNDAVADLVASVLEDSD